MLNEGPSQFNDDPGAKDSKYRCDLEDYRTSCAPKPEGPDPGFEPHYPPMEGGNPLDIGYYMPGSSRLPFERAEVSKVIDLEGSEFPVNIYNNQINSLEN